VASAAAPPPPAAAPRGPKPTAPPPLSSEGVRPRVLSSAKPQNAAAASLRQSASVGETYLNDLLTGGLLDVAGVRVPDMEFDLRPDRRWGRSTRRAFIFLFVVLVLGIGGGGTWYWWSQKQQAEAVARLQRDAKTAIGDGDFAGLETSLGKLRAALEKDKKNVLTYAYAAETGGLEALLYGTDADRVDEALKGVGHDITAGEPGARELVIGKAAVELSRLGNRDNPNTTLVAVAKQIDDFLAKHPDNRWAQWLRARELLAVGSRSAAKAALKTAADGEHGLIVAMVDQADLLAEEGKTSDALALYAKALARSKDHPLAILGRDLARGESTIQVNDAIDELNVKLDPKIKNVGPRVTAYRNLALALLEQSTEDYAHGGQDLKKAVAGAHPPLEARFWALVAWAHLQRGELSQARAARARVAQYTRTRGQHAEDDPAVMVVDAALALADGLPDKALDIAAKLEGVRAAIVRASAELDLGKAKDAVTDMDAVLKQAPDNLVAQILDAEAKMVSGSAKDRPAAADALEHLARKAKTKIGRHALGTAYLLVGDAKNAQPQLEQALDELGEDAPNPLAYRTHTELAQIAVAAKDLAGAEKHIDAAVALNPDFRPALGVKAKILLAKGDPDGALEAIRPLAKSGALPPPVELTLAEALCTHKGASDQDKADAARLLGEIKDKLPSPDELGRVAAICDPALPEKLGMTPPPGADAPKPAPHRHHHRRHR
jgi:predicted Zn-dependent protease